jgi:hypothetical protein
MDKSILIEKIKTGNYNKEQLLSWVQCLPGSTASRKPRKNKVGDVYMHPVFQHPYILLENKKTHWLCGLITTESKCPEILEPTQSRFFEGQFITKTIFTATEIVGTWANVYDNNKHLKSVLVKLKDIVK